MAWPLLQEVLQNDLIALPSKDTRYPLTDSVSPTWQKRRLLLPEVSWRFLDLPTSPIRVRVLRARVYSCFSGTLVIYKTIFAFSNTECYAVLSHLSCVQLFATLWTVAHQAPLSMGFSRQEYWSGLPCPPPGDLPDPEIEPMSLTSPALAGRFFTTSTTSVQSLSCVWPHQPQHARPPCPSPNPGVHPNSCPLSR